MPGPFAIPIAIGVYEAGAAAITAGSAAFAFWWNKKTPAEQAQLKRAAEDHFRVALALPSLPANYLLNRLGNTPPTVLNKIAPPKIEPPKPKDPRIPVILATAATSLIVPKKTSAPSPQPKSKTAPQPSTKKKQETSEDPCAGVKASLKTLKYKPDFIPYEQILDDLRAGKNKEAMKGRFVEERPKDNDNELTNLYCKDDTLMFSGSSKSFPVSPYLQAFFVDLGFSFEAKQGDNGVRYFSAPDIPWGVPKLEKFNKKKPQLHRHWKKKIYPSSDEAPDRDFISELANHNILVARGGKIAAHDLTFHPEFDCLPSIMQIQLSKIAQAVLSGTDQTALKELPDFIEKISHKPYKQLKRLIEQIDTHYYRDKDNGLTFETNFNYWLDDVSSLSDSHFYKATFGKEEGGVPRAKSELRIGSLQFLQRLVNDYVPNDRPGKVVLLEMVQKKLEAEE
jgi:hypothetical protein